SGPRRLPGKPRERCRTPQSGRSPCRPPGNPVQEKRKRVPLTDSLVLARKSGPLHTPVGPSPERLDFGLFACITPPPRGPQSVPVSLPTPALCRGPARSGRLPVGPSSHDERRVVNSHKEPKRHGTL